MKIQISAVGFLLCAMLIDNGSALAQQKFEPNVDSRREAIAKGQVKEFQIAMEALGLEAEKNQRWAEASSAYSEASYTAKITGEMHKAISHATKAIELAQRANNPILESLAMSWLSLAYRDVGQLEKDREWLRKALDVAKKIQGRTEIYEARLYILLGQSYLRQRETKEAIENFSYSVQVLDSLLTYLKRTAVSGNTRAAQGPAQAQIFNGLRGLGAAYLQAGNPQEAIKAFERGLSISETARLPKGAGQTQVFLGLGQAYLAQRDFTLAMENLNKGLQTAEDRQLASLIQEASSGIGDVYLQTGRPSEALPHYKKAIDSIESTRSLLQSEDLRMSFFEDKGESYAGIIQANVAAKNVEEAFNYTERARSRAFLDVLGSKVQLARSGTLLEHERALHARISVLKAMMQGPQGDSAQAQELRKQLAEAEQDYNEYLMKLRKENKEQASLMNVEPLTLKQVQERLDPGVTLLEYFVARGTVWLWVVERDRVEFVSASIPRSDLVSKVTSLRDAIYQFAEKERFSAPSQELHRLLIEPALPHLKGKELIIVPHDVLHYLPFQALQGSDGRYLIEKYPIYYLSSASLMQFTQEKRRAKGDDVLAFGNPDLGDPEKNLEFAELEAQEISVAYPKSAVYLKKDATEEKSKALSPNHNILHFATHAELKQDDPMSSAILLAKDDKEDGRLEVREIFRMNLRADLVVLSGCETGLGKLSTGDELVGLTRAFIYAGSPSVIASLWKVDDSSTAHLMSNFYRNLKTMTKVEALRQAQLAMIRGTGSSDLLARRGVGGIGKLGATQQVKTDSPIPKTVSTSHPYFWAPFILVGDGR